MTLQTFPFLVDGNYGNWTKLLPCSTTYGEGVEIWVRYCDSPPGKYGGNCSKKGADHENRLCAKEPCQGKIVREVPGIMLYQKEFRLSCANYFVTIYRAMIIYVY